MILHCYSTRTGSHHTMCYSRLRAECVRERAGHRRVARGAIVGRVRERLVIRTARSSALNALPVRVGQPGTDVDALASRVAEVPVDAVAATIAVLGQKHIRRDTSVSASHAYSFDMYQSKLSKMKRRMVD
jgi:hypothetical protein